MRSLMLTSKLSLDCSPTRCCSGRTLRRATGVASSKNTARRSALLTTICRVPAPSLWRPRSPRCACLRNAAPQPACGYLWSRHRRYRNRRPAARRHGERRHLRSGSNQALLVRGPAGVAHRRYESPTGRLSGCLCAGRRRKQRLEARWRRQTV